MSEAETSFHTIGIIGGGKSGTAMLRFLLKTNVAKVVFLMDPDPSALGMTEARNHRIASFTKLNEALRKPFPDFIFAVSIDGEMDEILKQTLRGTPTRIINQGTSRMIVELVEDNRTQIQDGVSRAVQTIKTELLTTLTASQGLVYNINEMMASMQMLALNASIEAARVGHAGKGFAVVAENMTKSVDSVKRLTQEIEGVNKTLTSISGKIDSVQDFLK